MSDVDNASAPNAAAQRLVSELKVSGHLMNLDAGLFCIVQTPSKSADRAVGLPGVRISLPPGQASRPDAVSISSFRDDGWLHAHGDAALVRVTGGPAQILVTVYQAPNVADSAPNLQVLRLIEDGGAAPAQPAPASAQPAPAHPVAAQAVVAPPPAMAAAPVAAAGKPEVMDMLAHIQGRGDVGGKIGQWLGHRGSRQWIEGFALAPLAEVPSSDLEYQAVLGRGWLSPWVEGGQFCGSRGMALPLLGIRVRVKGASAAKYECAYSASFVDGTASGPAKDGAPCESDSLSAIEAFLIEFKPKAQASRASAATATAAPMPAAAPAKPASNKPAPKRPAPEAAPPPAKKKPSR